MQCIVPGCDRRAGGGARAEWAKTCNTHRSNARRNGHPEQETIHAYHLKSYLAIIDRYLKLHPDHSAWRTATERWMCIVDAAAADLGAYERGAAMRDTQRQVAEEVVKLSKSAKPQDVWRIVAATCMCWDKEPYRFKSDRAAWFQIARLTRRLGDVNVSTYWNHAEKRVRRMYRDPPPRVLEALGRDLAVTLGPLGLILARREDVERARQQQSRAAFQTALGDLLTGTQGAAE